jgi:ubiquitin C-terminal hydrolase
MPGARANALPRLAFVPGTATASKFSAAEQTPAKAPAAVPANPLEKHTTLQALTTPPGPGALDFLTITPHGPGLANAGNTCYANSTLQALLHTPALLHVVQAHVHRAHASAPGRAFCALCALKALARTLHSPGGRQGKAIVPATFVDGRNLRQISRTFRQYRQEDAHEFLRGLLDSATRSSLLGCGAPLPSHGDPPISHAREMSSAVHSACGGVLQSGVTCHSCGYESVTLEPFLDLSIGTAATVERGLARFTAPDRLDGSNMYCCDSCRKRVVASKRLSVRTAPNTLTIHLKRFDGMRKDRANVKYQATLDLSAYMVKRADGPKSVLYNLTAVLVHDGHGTRSGHYYSYVKGSNGTWCLKNDSSATVVSESRALQQQAYILFYSLDPSCVNRVQTPSPAPRPVVISAVAEDATLSRVAKAPPPTPESKTENVAPNVGVVRAGPVVPSGNGHVNIPTLTPPPPRAPSPGPSTDVDMSSKEDNGDVMSGSSDDSTVHAFIAGGGRVVRKLAQRILNYVGSGSDNEGNVDRLVHMHRPPPNEERGNSGLVFRDSDIGGWIDEAPRCDDIIVHSKTIQKRARAKDAADADYDRGRPKKVRRSAGGALGSKGRGPGTNPFAAAERVAPGL